MYILFLFFFFWWYVIMILGKMVQPKGLIIVGKEHKINKIIIKKRHTIQLQEFLPSFFF